MNNDCKYKSIAATQCCVPLPPFYLPAVGDQITSQIGDLRNDLINPAEKKHSPVRKTA